jgi:uncharacterized Zn-binding protein involved in type VI secretion
MSKNLIVLGDKTSHGGTVIEASVETSVGNVRVARVGDLVSCPQQGHGTCPIVTGDPTTLIDGKPAARDGDQTACGAKLVSSQGLTADLC